jgi:hypothetical protein
VWSTTLLDTVTLNLVSRSVFSRWVEPVHRDTRQPIADYRRNVVILDSRRRAARGGLPQGLSPQRRGRGHRIRTAPSTCHLHQNTERVATVAMNILDTKWCDDEQTQPPMRFCWFANSDFTTETNTNGGLYCSSPQPRALRPQHAIYTNAPHCVPARRACRVCINAEPTQDVDEDQQRVQNETVWVWAPLANHTILSLFLYTCIYLPLFHTPI